MRTKLKVKEEKTETIGEAAEKLAKEYFELYLSMRHDENSDLRDKAKQIAEHDLYVKLWVAEYAIKGLEKLILEHSMKEPKKEVA